MLRMTPEEFDVYVKNLPNPQSILEACWKDTAEVMVLKFNDGSSKSILVSRDFVSKRYA